jgi:hypothetical protein
MLPRVLEPEVMDTPEEARDYDAMDHSAVNRVFVADFLAVSAILDCWLSKIDTAVRVTQEVLWRLLGDRIIDDSLACASRGCPHAD